MVSFEVDGGMSGQQTATMSEYDDVFLRLVSYMIRLKLHTSIITFYMPICNTDIHVHVYARWCFKAVVTQSANAAWSNDFAHRPNVEGDRSL